MRKPQRHIPAPARPVTPPRGPASTGVRGPRPQRGPASEPAPLSTPRIFVSSRRRRPRPVSRLLFALLLSTVALGMVLTTIV
jgi:hypothetical protein